MQILAFSTLLIVAPLAMARAPSLTGRVMQMQTDKVTCPPNTCGSTCYLPTGTIIADPSQPKKNLPDDDDAFGMPDDDTTTIIHQDTLGPFAANYKKVDVFNVTIGKFCAKERCPTRADYTDIYTKEVTDGLFNCKPVYKAHNNNLDEEFYMYFADYKNGEGGLWLLSAGRVFQPIGQSTLNYKFDDHRQAIKKLQPTLDFTDQEDFCSRSSNNCLSEAVAIPKMDDAAGCPSAECPFTAECPSNQNWWRFPAKEGRPYAAISATTEGETTKFNCTD
mmetsp:Transcript_9923/g.25615  ORF Transcript_9923/g.25615 Transcript_9923/m.25615 type:complete len:277 (+) Transcript_9923:44-874(+)